jgi:hypothetical protein
MNEGVLIIAHSSVSIHDSYLQIQALITVCLHF